MLFTMGERVKSPGTQVTQCEMCDDLACLYIDIIGQRVGVLLIDRVAINRITQLYKDTSLNAIVKLQISALGAVSLGWFHHLRHSLASWKLGKRTNELTWYIAMLLIETERFSDLCFQDNNIYIQIQRLQVFGHCSRTAYDGTLDAV